MSIITGYQGYFNPSQIVSIASGDTDSSVINLGGMSLCGFILPSILTGSTIGFLVANSIDGFQANGEILFSGAPTVDDTLTINGTTITFVSTSPTDNEVLIGVDGPTSAALLQAFLEGSSDVGLSACTYSTVGALTTVVSVLPGTVGNAYTFTKSSSNITLSPAGGTLSGGGFLPLYDDTNTAISYTVSPGRCYSVDPQVFQGVQFLKLQSGSEEASARSIVCQLKGL